jgi:hypothetical protein
MSVKGEKYKSKKAMKKHEKSEGKKERMMEYGKKSSKMSSYKALEKGAKGNMKRMGKKK